MSAIAEPHQTATDHNAILQEFFGGVDVATSTSHWTPRHMPKDFADSLGESDGRARTWIVYDQPFVENNTSKRMLVFSTVPDVADSWECHACAPLIGIAILRCPATKACVTEARNDFIAQTGQKGKPPELALMRLGPENVGLLTTYEYFWDGEGDGITHLFAMVGGELRMVLDLRTAQEETEVDDCASPGRRPTAECRNNRYSRICRSAEGRRYTDFREMCSSWTGTLKLAPSANIGGWRDLLLTQTVRAAAPGAFAPGIYRTRFVFRDGTYQPERANAQGPPYHFQDYNLP